MRPDRSRFAVVSGDASAEEIAAVVTALTAAAGAAGGGAGRGAPRARGLRAWADRSATLRKPLHPGPDGWRASARPS